MELHRCARCGGFFWEDEMQRCKRPEGQEDQYTYCRACHRARSRLWLENRREQDPEYSKNQARKFRESHPDYDSDWMQDNKAIHPLKTRAYNIANRADLVSQPCEVCGDTNTYKHHDDYSKPLEVRWFCPKHHQRLHSSVKEA